MKEFHFTVDAALLEELGERLVGQPHVALAELVKNAYDADAHAVRIHLGADSIEVVDNGHGMTEHDLETLWMRIGTRHKAAQSTSRELGRPLTGAKGVGRLSMQLIADEVELMTVAKGETSIAHTLEVDWPKASRQGDLINATALYSQASRTEKFPEESEHGTRIRLKRLKQTWRNEQIVELARELWPLTPPFLPNPRLRSDGAARFDVELKAGNAEIEEKFRAQMRAVLQLWHARIKGKLTAGRGPRAARQMSITVEFDDGEMVPYSYEAPSQAPRHIEFEIRVFDLQHRQPYGITVKEAREYFNDFGGVHIYDAGFHLPYYGPDTDWLEIEIDHSHRLQASKLLPIEIYGKVKRAMNHLPTNSRLFGVVHIDTALERSHAPAPPRGGTSIEHLMIAITRDRLVANKASEALRDAVRTAVDFYAVQQARRTFEKAQAKRATEPLRKKFERVEEVLDAYKGVIPVEAYQDLRINLGEVVQAGKSEAEYAAELLGLFGSLATAGMIALAHEHEANKQYAALERLADRITGLAQGSGGRAGQLGEAAGEMRAWVKRARETRMMFAHLLDGENRDAHHRLRANAVVEDVVHRTSGMLAGIEVDTSGVDTSLRFPAATNAELTAILQNVLLNAANALLDSQVRRIRIRSVVSWNRRAILVEDTGSGVDLKTARELFKPFVREQEISAERRALGYGGTGLGLTIVKALAESRGCSVDFVASEKGYNTAFKISWKEVQSGKEKANRDTR